MMILGIAFWPLAPVVLWYLYRQGQKEEQLFQEHLKTKYPGYVPTVQPAVPKAAEREYNSCGQ